jgi:glucosyl-dolichyl phosphate glucuronosyltransferase
VTFKEAPRALEVSVVLSTYNRAGRLPAALEALLNQAGEVPYEVIVVDNNSSDDTAAVVRRIAARSAGRVRYAFEPRQGLSHGRNAGIGLAQSSIIAFTDDDVRVSSDWIGQLRRAFNEHPDAGYIGGRVLPLWLSPPPAWLTTAHWGPLALQDYGLDTHVSGRERAVCLVGANLAFRKHVFDRIGLFTASLGRVKDGIGSTEDHDMQLRAWRAGVRGFYVPALVVLAEVTPDRLHKRYHRHWHQGHGRHCAMMRLRELVPADLGPMSEPEDIVTLFGSPAFVYADLVRTAALWLNAVCRRGESRFYYHRFHHLCSYIGTRHRISTSENQRSIAAELKRFSRLYLAKRAAHQARLSHD